MKILHPIRKLDIVLNILSDYDESDLGATLPYIVYHSNITEIVDLRIPYQEVELIWGKLIKDEDVLLNCSFQVNKGENRYFITFDGVVFNQSGGYKEMITISGQNEKRIVRNEKWLVRGTWTASVVGVLLLLWQLFLYFLPGSQRLSFVFLAKIDLIHFFNLSQLVYSYPQEGNRTGRT